MLNSLSSPPIQVFNTKPRVSIFPFILLLVLVSIIIKPASACLTYSGVFPFDEDQPFVAEIIDNGVRTCWINMTYTTHWRLQVLENGGWRGSEEWKWQPWKFECTEKEWEGKLKGNATVRSLNHCSSLSPSQFPHIPLHTLSNFRPSSSNTNSPAQQDRKYHAEAGVGLRGITYRAHGEKFWFNPDKVEDVAGERWVYSKRMWCPEEGKGKGKGGK
ncbi:hypothetical protein CJF32_00002778 [Rutstroemia sp. NJR-2017a WRK4]|nr:hypothetical protein CJF32_00002778 [Rutstroemia sp. NJR-2017a WRK4]